VEGDKQAFNLEERGREMNKAKLVLIVVALVLGLSGISFAAEKIIFSFEEENEGWEIPDWALEKEDYVADSLNINTTYASEGKSSLELMANFPGGAWTSAYIEVQEYFDWTPYESISVDVYLPYTAPAGLRGKIVLTVGENWLWTEMSRSVPLEPGKWTLITADLKAGSTDWKKLVHTDSFRTDVRKLDIRIESNMKPAYQGPIYIDNIRLSEKEGE
jgi:hypothetical protein